MKSALIIGATGFVGGYLLAELLKLNKYELIIAPVRKPSLNPHPTLEEIIFDFQDINAIDRLKPVDHLFCCLGTTISAAGSKDAFRFVDFKLPLIFARWAERNGSEYYSIVTAMGANSHSRIFYNKVKGNIEDELKKLSIPKIHIFRPSLILGPRKEFRLGEIIGKGLMKIISPLMIGPADKYRGIHARSIAKGMINYLEKNKKGMQIIESNKI